MRGDLTMLGEKEAARKHGQEEAWEMARWICRTADEYPRNKIFESGIVTIICNFTYDEAVEMMRGIEEAKKEIKAGDIVKISYSDGISEVALVTSELSEGNYAVVWNNGIVGIVNKKDYRSIYRTSRTLPVKDWLRQIGEIE